MFLAYISFTFFVSLMLSIIWSSKGVTNTLIKSVFIVHAIWTAMLLIGVLWPHIQSSVPSIRLV